MVYFPETGHNVPPDFATYYAANGGLSQFGDPLSEVLTEVLENGRPYEVQYFERSRFERHPEVADPAYRVLLGQFGRRILAMRGPPPPAPPPAPPASPPPPPPSPPSGNCHPSRSEERRVGKECRS